MRYREILERFMKAFAALILAAASLSGCAIVPYGPAPGIYAAPPPPVVVVRPYGYYGGYYGGPYWRHGWR